jgi:hypothetical protein
VTEQHKQKCLYRQALAFNEDEKKRFMDMYRKVHGQEALDKFREAVNSYFKASKNE